ncbi:tyrosine-type recombinase/integrase [Lactiplantibacillus plantarum]|uniref:tyrosine-type recombinase/integrase n=1 Tax=Lactiplantibacillus plantarum TaxID=1590 RepID=UPI0006AD7A40|nr:tyrosine-type recombinase/integrase [Lactiplantibacillus plantarum]ALC08644.1 hypothetical protein JM48_1436 [Lactiplantibacillus plantarum]
MASFCQYELKNGKKRWEFWAYAGVQKGNGKQKLVHRRGFKLKREAQDASKLVEAEIIHNNRLADNNASMTLGEYLDYWIDNLKVNVKMDTLRIHQRNIDYYIKPRIGEFPLSDYSFNDHQKFINGLFTEKGVGRAKQGYAWNTVQSINQTLSNSLKKAVTLGYIKVNPATNVEFDHQYEPQQRKLRYYTRDQTDRFLKFSQYEQMYIWYPFFLLMFDCGLRMGEDMALRWSRIDFTHQTVNIDVTRIYNAETHVNAVGMKDLLLDTPKTKKSIRKIPMTDRVYVALKDLLRKQRSERDVIQLKYNHDILSDLIFIKPKGRLNGYPISQTGIQIAMARISERAGLPHLNVHGCRHTYGVRLRESGVSLEDIKDLMGHSDLGTTRIYAEITPKVKDEAVSKLNSFLQN